ncbi:hypothetical protein ASG47_12680 [Devosia sp. Leaf420]|nr:hypothetical protein ASG47_12680 [Devosia sp. Leaf420]
MRLVADVLAITGSFGGVFLSPSGRGGSATGRVGEGDLSTLAQISPSSGAARHLLPEGEKNKKALEQAS